MATPTATLPAFAAPAWPAPAPRAARPPSPAEVRARGVAGPARESVAADPDRDLAERARRGDEAAFRALVERHRDRVFAVARRVVRSDADAEEVAQDAFVRAWRALPEFRGESRFGTWLHAIAVRRALDRAETLGRRRGREFALDTAPEGAGAVGGPDPEALLRARRLDGLMGELSGVQRAAVSLYYFEDHSVERVAEALGLPGNTVKTHLSRARAVLREAWLRTEGGA